MMVPFAPEITTKAYYISFKSMFYITLKLTKIVYN